MFSYRLFSVFFCVLLTLFSLNVYAKDNCTVIYVQQFGAVGDGVTDDTAAIQAALSATGNSQSKVMFERNKTYLMQKEVYLYSNTVIDLNNSVIRDCYKGGVNDEYVEWANGLRFLNNPESVKTEGYGALTNITISNGTIDGANEAGISGVTFGLMHASHLTFKNIVFRDCMAGTHVIDLGGCQDIRIDNCNFTGAHIAKKEWRYREMIQIDSALYKGMPYWDGIANIAYDELPCQNIVISDCNFERGQGTHNPNAIGTHTAYSGSSQNITIKNNVFRDCYSYAIRFPKVNKLNITNNQFISKNRRHKELSGFIKIYGISQLGIPVSACHSINIKGNIFQGSAKNNCIVPVQIEGYPDAPFFDIKICENQLRGGYRLKKVKFLWQCRNVTNCRIKHNSTDAIPFIEKTIHRGNPSS